MEFGTFAIFENATFNETERAVICPHELVEYAFCELSETARDTERHEEFATCETEECEISVEFNILTEWRIGVDVEFQSS